MARSFDPLESQLSRLPVLEPDPDREALLLRRCYRVMAGQRADGRCSRLNLRTVAFEALQREHRQPASMSWHHNAIPMADESEDQELRRWFELIRAESQSRSEERSARLAHRLIRSVLPLFVIDERDHLERIGTCVMVRVEAQLFLLTAGHVLADSGGRQLWAISGPKGRTIGLPAGTYVSHNGDAEIDVGVIPLPANALHSFFDGCTPIEESEINESYVVDYGIGKNSIYLIGYPASNSQVRVNHADKTVRQTSFQFTGLAEVEEVYRRESLSVAHHLVVEFANVRSGGQPATPPKLQGVSGGGMFHLVTREADATIRLVAIATEHRRAPELVVGTRIEHFLAVARQLRARESGFDD